MKLFTNAVLVAVAFGITGISNASTYYLEYNNLGLSGNVASVTLTDNGNDVDITVAAISPIIEVASFGFNLGGNPVSISCSGLPATYSCNADGSFQYNGGGSFADQADPPNFGNPNRYSSFSFKLLDYNEVDFVANANGNLFATHIYPASGPTGFAYGGTVVPVPAAVWLFGSGLLGLAGVARRKRA